jgi:protease II
MTHPPRPHQTRPSTKVHPVLGGFSKDDYQSERLWAVAPDSTKVPISIVYRKVRGQGESGVGAQ